jgi:hypothetical protein
MEQLDNREAAGVVTVCFGIVTLVASLSADALGIGKGADWGYYQMVGTMLGATVIVVGLLLMLRE